MEEHQTCIECGKDFPHRGSKYYTMNFCDACGDKLQKKGPLGITCRLLKHTTDENYDKARGGRGL